MIALQGDDSFRPQRATAKGIYDNSILVLEGEALFSDWDGYACELLVKLKANGQRIFVDGKEAGLEIADYDYTKLKLFFVSLLWRAHTTKHLFFGNVELDDSHEKKIRQMILNGLPGEVDDYPVTIGYCEDNKGGWLPVASPWCSMRGNKKYYTFFLASWIVQIRPDDEGCDPDEHFYALSPHWPLRLANLGRLQDLTIFKDWMLPKMKERWENEPGSWTF
ncbi:hypothetical protein [Pelagicoccus sp. SDUM812002]|uniref:hypothetical protein n=1 Tax=Pelagicoccus sp. SDUM812002 TaxID=3041266 RepID=UPI00280D5D11|nr:hypothetical protein [Pelagicoccus sp. SDUM812002]MDQ8184254.1 hypothetical protein [Pelagicoccus sp. SDUM812002]